MSLWSTSRCRVQISNSFQMKLQRGSHKCCEVWSSYGLHCTFLEFLLSAPTEIPDRNFMTNFYSKIIKHMDQIIPITRNKCAKNYYKVIKSLRIDPYQRVKLDSCQRGNSSVKYPSLGSCLVKNSSGSTVWPHVISFTATT